MSRTKQLYDEYYGNRNSLRDELDYHIQMRIKNAEEQEYEHFKNTNGLHIQ